MTVHLSTAAVDRYGPLADCRPAYDAGVSIVAGPNESGKTLYLEAVLQLLDPDVTTHMDPGPRVAGDPTGRVVVEVGGERHALGDGTALSDVSRIGPRHLRTLFVVRDSDLAMPDGTEYYTSLVEHLGDVHTSDIEAIREGLLAEGRLTPTNLNLKDREYDTKTVRAAATSLAEDVEDYLETAAARDVPELERRRFAVRTELREVESRLATQRTAREILAVEDAAERLATYTSATEELEAATADRATLTDLRERTQAASTARRRIDELESTLDRKRAALETKRDALATARERRTELAQREGDVGRVETALEDYRNRRPDLASEGSRTGVAARLAHRRYATVAGLVGAAIAGGAGALAGSIAAVSLGVALLVVAGGAWAAHYRLASRAAEAAERERDLLRTARDAGFDVDSPADVPPKLREYRGALEGADSRVRDLEAAVDQLGDRVEALEGSLRDVSEERREQRAAVTATLEDAGVDSIEAYEATVEELETLEDRRSRAETILVRELGEPDTDESRARIDAWESALADRRADLGGTDVASDRYREDELERLDREQAALEAELAELRASLEEHTDRIEAFERRTNDLSPPPFVESTPSLRAHTVDGLRALVEDLDDLVSAIDRNAAISEKAIDVLDAIRAEEERKVATLFDPDAPASAVLSRLTDGRYTAVEYTPESEGLEVRTADGRTFTPQQLSRGTRDQLYFAARVSLASQLLDGAPGFLLLDDPFLAADPNRLRNGFETLQALADDGWQILYLTAKPEVHDGMADAFDCPVHRLPVLER